MDVCIRFLEPPLSLFKTTAGLIGKSDVILSLQTILIFQIFKETPANNTTAAEAKKKLTSHKKNINIKNKQINEKGLYKNLS